MPEFQRLMPYDPTTSGGKLRLLLADTDPDAFVWDDTEINAALSYLDSNIELAAAWLLESAAASNAKIAVLSKVGGDSTDLTKLAGELRAQAKRLRDIAIVPAATNAPDLVFSTTADEGQTVGTMDVW